MSNLVGKQNMVLKKRVYLHMHRAAEVLGLQNVSVRALRRDGSGSGIGGQEAEPEQRSYLK